MVLFNLNRMGLVSALEQFEIVPYFTLNLGNLPYLQYLSYNFPISLINNITLLFILFIYSLFVISRALPQTTSKLNYALVFSFFVQKLSLFVYHQILGNLQVGKNRFFTYYLTLFTFLLVCNLLGMVPYSLTITSYIIITLTLSGMSFFGNMLLAIRANKVKFFSFFSPSGISEVLVPFMIVIEIISYITRLFSMAIRLFANMLSGHALVKILSGLVFSSFDNIICYGVFSVLFNVVVIAVTALEVVVASLQAYVFVVLSVIYTNEAILLH